MINERHFNAHCLRKDTPLFLKAGIEKKNPQRIIRYKCFFPEYLHLNSNPTHSVLLWRQEDVMASYDL